MTFKQEIDAWIKNINTRMNDVELCMKEQEIEAENIEHNYELIEELHEDMQQLKTELKAVRKVLMSLIITSVKNDRKV